MDIEEEFDTYKDSDDTNERKNKKMVHGLRRKIGMGRAVDTTDDGTTEHIREVELSLLKENPFQPRRAMDVESIVELALSIKENGLLQPVAVVPDGKGSYTILYGHRRIEAVRHLGWKRVPAIVKKPDSDAAMRSKALVENMQRENLTPIEKALAIKEALDSGDFKNQSDVARSLGLDKSYISKMLKILTMPEDVVETLLADRTISDIAIIDAIRRIEDERVCREVFYWYVEERPDKKTLLERIRKEAGGATEHRSYDIKNSPRGCTIKLPKLDQDKLEKVEGFLKELFGDH